MGSITTTAAALQGGVTAVAGVSKRFRAEVDGIYAAGELLRIILTNEATGLSDIAGYGTVTSLQPSFAFTFDEKVNLLASTAWYFSGVGNPTLFNDPDALGNGFIELADTFGTAEDLVAMAAYQGGVALIGRRTVQMWDVDPDIQNYNRRQILQNIGTVAKRSVASVGDADVYMLADNGVRSIQVRDASNNAIVADAGTPVDELIQAALQTLSTTEKAAACGVVEPSANRYWLNVPDDHIYVLSKFPSSGIMAWTRYRPGVQLAPGTATYAPDVAGTYKVFWTNLVIGRRYIYQAGPVELNSTAPAVFMCDGDDFHGDELGDFVATSTNAEILIEGDAPPGDWSGSLMEIFEPELFTVQGGRVYARAGDDILIYGGVNNQTYDRCFPQWDIPFLNAKTPATRKLYNGLDAICEGTWRVSLGVDVADGDDVSLVYANTGSSVKRGKSLAAKQGTHFKLRGKETSASYARFSSAILHYEGGDNK